MAKIIGTETIKHETGEQSTSYKIDFDGDMALWFDTWLDDDGEITGDWNKYIFTVGNEKDNKIKAFQDANSDAGGAYNYATALETCEQYIVNNK